MQVEESLEPCDIVGGRSHSHTAHGPEDDVSIFYGAVATVVRSVVP